MALPGPFSELNPIEQLETCTNWFNQMDANISFRLKSAEDAIKLWRFALAHPELVEFCDESTGEDGDWTEEHFLSAIGYDPR